MKQRGCMEAPIRDFTVKVAASGRNMAVGT